LFPLGNNGCYFYLLHYIINIDIFLRGYRLKMKIAILSDSSCTKNEFKNRNGFTYVPLMITLPDGSQLSDDDDLDVDRFYKELDKTALKTSLTPPGVMTQQ
jgi:fatty acid-binding protein DegV